MKYGSIVVTFNRKDLLLEAIDSLLNQSVVPSKVIIIDNHSTDGTRSLLVEKGILDNDKIEYRYLPENIGGAGGFAKGMTIANTMGDLDWVSLSDDDAIFKPDYFEKLIEYHEDNPQAKILTGSVYLEDGRLQIDQRNKFTNTTTFRCEAIPKAAYQGNFEFDQYTFCGVFMDMAVINEVGIADEGFFIWWDDCEYSVRTRKIAKPINISNAVLIHKTYLPSLDFKTKFVPDWRKYYGLRNRLITIFRWGDNRAYIYIWLLMFYARFIFKLVTPYYRGYRRFITKVYWLALKDAVKGKTGLNKNFMPGQKF